MAILEIALFSLSVVATAAICAGAYFLAEQRKAEIQQAGIDRRAAMKHSAEPYQDRTEWWQSLLLKLTENPEVMKLITPHLPGLLEKFSKKP